MEQGTVITLVSGRPGQLTDAVLATVAQSVKAKGIGDLQIDALRPQTAADISFPHWKEDLARGLGTSLTALGAFDVFIQPQGDTRKKRLLVADMDATTIREETLDEMAAEMGMKDRIAAITQQAMRGELDFAQSLQQRVALLKGMPLSALVKVRDHISFSPGAKTLVKTMARHGARCVLVTGGFDFFAGHVAMQAGFHDYASNRLEIENDGLTGRVLPPVLDKDAKKRTLESEAKKLQIPLALSCAVGDGANDVPMLQAAGAGVGYFAKPAAQAATPHQIRHGDLTAILYMQGYKYEQFAEKP